MKTWNQLSSMYETKIFLHGGYGPRGVPVSARTKSSYGSYFEKILKTWITTEHGNVIRS